MLTDIFDDTFNKAIWLKLNGVDCLHLPTYDSLNKEVAAA